MARSGTSRRERSRDWAAFFCEYSRYMEPAPAGAVDDLPGMNVSYDRAALAAIDDLLREGRWESWLHARLVERGFELWCEPAAVLDHAKDFGVREFTSQRYHYSRAYAGMRNPDLGSRRVALRARRPVDRARHAVAHHPQRAPPPPSRARLCPRLAPDPVLLGGLVGGEAIGYVFGGGRSLLRVR